MTASHLSFVDEQEAFEIMLGERERTTALGARGTVMFVASIPEASPFADLPLSVAASRRWVGYR